MEQSDHLAGTPVNPTTPRCCDSGFHVLLRHSGASRNLDVMCSNASVTHQLRVPPPVVVLLPVRWVLEVLPPVPVPVVPEPVVGPEVVPEITVPPPS